MGVWGGVELPEAANRGKFRGGAEFALHFSDKAWLGAGGGAEKRRRNGRGRSGAVSISSFTQPRQSDSGPTPPHDKQTTEHHETECRGLGNREGAGGGQTDVTDVV